MPLTTDELQRLDSVHAMFSREEQAYEMKQKDDAAFEEAKKQWRKNDNMRSDAFNASKRQWRQRLGKVKQIRESCGIQFPIHSFYGNHPYGTVYKENIGSTKRKIRSGMRGSRLHQKEEDAKTVEKAGKDWEEKIKGRMKGLRGQPEGCSPRDFQALSQFLTQDEGSNKVLLPGQMQEGSLSREQIKACIGQYMELDFGVDLRTDETIAKDSLRLEELAGKTEAMRQLFDDHPEMAADLDQEEKQNLLAKLDLGEQIANYYTLQKKVMTNSWYRTHYNSEITYRCHLGDTLEQKNLTALLWQAEFIKNREEFTEDNAGRQWLNNFQDETDPGEEQIEAQAYEVMRRAPLYREYGKEDAAIEDSRHADFFRLNCRSESGSLVYERLVGSPYYVVGEPNAMHESLARKASNLPRLKAIQHMDKEQFEQMMEDLVKVPAHMSDPGEVEACRQANLNGVRMFREQIRKQVGYMKRKYGNGYLLLTPQELVEHRQDFENDFANMQGMSYFLKYIKTLPGMFDKNDPADQEMVRWFNYFQTINVSDGTARTNYVSKTYKNFSEYKNCAVKHAMGTDATRTDLIKCSDTEHLDVRWGTFFDETDVLFDEVLNCIKYTPVSRTSQELGMRDPLWSEMTLETRRMSRSEAINHFIEKEYAIARENQEFDSDHQGRMQTADRMLQNIDQLRTQSTGSGRFLYDQMSEDMREWLRENRGY